MPKRILVPCDNDSHLNEEKSLNATLSLVNVFKGAHFAKQNVKDIIDSKSDQTSVSTSNSVKEEEFEI
ncbi:hypothetical protein ACOME3_007937 [Neoechinorhynchus agilis]